MSELTDEQKNLFNTYFDSLTDSERTHIMSHFDKGTECCIIFAEDKFIACNYVLPKEYVVLVQTEYWTLGTIK